MIQIWFVNKSRSFMAILGATLALIGIALGLALLDESLTTQETVPKLVSDEIEIIEVTGTPADNYSPDERDQHCGQSDVKSNQYIKEFEIPTPCTQPLSIIVDSEDKIWLIQTNLSLIHI